MPTGTVKWYNAAKGYGFLTSEGESQDIFVHASEVEAARLGALKDGETIRFEAAPGKPGKKKAVNLVRV